MQQASVKKIESVWRGSKAIIVTAVAILAVASLLSVNASAACSVSTGPKADLILPPPLQEHATVPQSSEPAQQPLDLDSQSTSKHRRASIVGFWFVKLYSGGQLFDQGFDQWYSDGLEVLNDFALPEPPSSAGSVCLGVWKQTGHNTYKLRHPAVNFDASGNPSAMVVLLETITVDADGDSYRGTFVYDAYDPVSGTLISETTGELNAHRITVD